MSDELKIKRALVLTKTPFVSLFFPSLALPRSGTMGIFSDYDEPPQKRFGI